MTELNILALKSYLERKHDSGNLILLSRYLRKGIISLNSDIWILRELLEHSKGKKDLAYRINEFYHKMNRPLFYYNNQN